MKPFPFYKQHDAMDCGPTCLRMVAKYYGRNYSAQALRERTQIGKDGVNLLGISEAAESIGFRTVAVKIPFEKLNQENAFPCIVHWSQNHFVVVYGVVVKPFSFLNRRIKQQLSEIKVQVADPARGLITYTREEFEKQWATTIVNGQKMGVALLLEPTPALGKEHELEGRTSEEKGLGTSRLGTYLYQHRRLVEQLGVGLLVASLLQLIFPFLTQSVVDVGIQTRNPSFILLVLLAQLALTVGRTSVEFIRSWLLMHLSTRLNLSLLSDFLIKLTRLPLSFFDTKQFGDIMQRIGDHHRIEQFLTGQTLNTLFSLFNLLVFGAVLAFYNLTIFGVLMLSALLYAGWVVLFLKFRRKLDYQRFSISAKSNSTLVQLIQGMHEIRLAGAETPMRWQWEQLQTQSFKLGMKGLSVSQWQQAGALFINEGKSIFITFLSAQAVINGQLTLGGMLAVQYIIGQVNAPLQQLIGLVQSGQDAKISLERLNEIYELEDEETGQGLVELPTSQTLFMQSLSFTYRGAGNEPVLNDIHLTIPQGKTTAIVGMSGSGKTTLLKLLLRFYDPTQGKILIGGVGLNNISHKYWRKQCGVVMQDGFLFSDTIARNIAVGAEIIDRQKLYQAAQVANILDFIESLPLGFHTKIGAEGMGVSQGQKQRLLIARAVYKDPQYIFFDEATNALDAHNEAVIVENLNEFFKNRTVIVVAHRLSTVKNADQIVVLDKGRITEIGTHSTLTSQQGDYYQLVKNQLEL
ncbi:ATP-binding cassette domain-containing protein [Runella sp. CRIBMP]|uniref:peptidase domain-containing ABC transporter n=1 Tax=Runella sp. CRIBMP TaxID=2683261 RepID=UPI0014120D15|nr:peptidase domain-containing ABC transporter [Runella sp. CRIBMP]NBB19355.1 ATP-binding cassette domain-containing protein [Runella sp. CRIBMP]